MIKDEQAIANLKKLKSFHNGSYGADIDRAIKALEQEPVLDKIRAEIEQMDFDFGDFYDRTDTIQEMVLEVIDKYREKVRKHEI